MIVDDPWQALAGGGSRRRRTDCIFLGGRRRTRREQSIRDGQKRRIANLQYTLLDCRLDQYGIINNFSGITRAISGITRTIFIVSSNFVWYLKYAFFVSIFLRNDCTLFRRRADTIYFIVLYCRIAAFEQRPWLVDARTAPPPNTKQSQGVRCKRVTCTSTTGRVLYRSSSSSAAEPKTVDDAAVMTALPAATRSPAAVDDGGDVGRSDSNGRDAGIGGDESDGDRRSQRRRRFFRRALPPERLGQRHETLGSFRTSVSRQQQQQQQQQPPKQRRYALVVVTATSEAAAADSSDRDDASKQASSRRNCKILLGMKHRGFGRGMYNSFGGKLESKESPEQCAQRELLEETNIQLDSEYVASCKVGTLFFTFDDSDAEMVVHLFHTRIRLFAAEVRDTAESVNKSNAAVVGTTSNNGTSIPVVDPAHIRGCDEITPRWFDDWYDDMPLDNMFADDSIWLTRLLVNEDEYDVNDEARGGGAKDLAIDGWFHFEAGGQTVNTVQHYYVDIRPRANDVRVRSESGSVAVDRRQTPLNLEKRLFHELHKAGINSPTIKEFNEAYAFCNAVRGHGGSKKSKSSSFQYDLVIDVAGGHGALAALFLITTTAKEAVVVDPATVGNRGVERAWQAKYFPDKRLRYRRECLRTGLPLELDAALGGLPPDAESAVVVAARNRILVVACHSCQHLSDEVLEICCKRYAGVGVAVLPCCQTDPTQVWKATSRNLKIPMQYTMDLVRAFLLCYMEVSGR